jgi:A/G-specific adenine glycosylase
VNDFAQRILTWFEHHGRKDLPWQQNPTGYRVWVSEIMLQQTQVSTVIPYYERFMQRFPDVFTLAQAPLDEVLHAWSGLGYYARARNLHQTAQLLAREYAGEFPARHAQVQQLPGIGRSTASAILAFSQGQPLPILDGNVKRVLARHHAVPGWPGQTQVLKQLWQFAELNTPDEQVAAYNQAMMDMGSLICTRSQPKCAACPIASTCAALAQHDWRSYPGKKPRKDLPVRCVQMLILRDPAKRILLEQRPPQGIWGGLWSFPELPLSGDITQWCTAKGWRILEHQADLPVRRHTFSHFHLDILPREILLAEPGCLILEEDKHLWYNLHQPNELGLAAPVARLLSELSQ